MTSDLARHVADLATQRLPSGFAIRQMRKAVRSASFPQRQPRWSLSWGPQSCTRQSSEDALG